MRRSATVASFAVAGFAGGFAASLLLWSMHHPEIVRTFPGPVALQLGSPATLLVFPLAAAALAALWARVLESKVGRERVGFAFGCAVAALAFVSFIVLLSALYATASDGASMPAAYGRLKVFAGFVAAYLLYGGALVGWALVLLGGLTGWLAGGRTPGTDDAPTRAEAMVARARERLRSRPAPPDVAASPVPQASPRARVPFADSPASRLGLSLLEIPVAFGVGYAVFLVAYRIGCRMASCYDLQAIGPGLAALAIAAITGIVYWSVAVWLNKRLVPRLVWDGVAVMVAAAGFLVPLYIAHARESEQEARSRLNEQQAAYRREMWIEDMKKEAHGPPGAIPPMLDVVDEGAAAVVTNTSTRGRNVSLGRVVPDAAAPGGWRGCAMVSDDKWANYSPWLVPNQRMRYVLVPECADAFRGALIEYRVGAQPHEEGWWSDSAFATPDGRKPRPRR